MHRGGHVRPLHALQAVVPAHQTLAVLLLCGLGTVELERGGDLHHAREAARHDIMSLGMVNTLCIIQI